MSSDTSPGIGEQPPPTIDVAPDGGEQPRGEQTNPTEAIQEINDLSVLEGILWGKGDEEPPAPEQQPEGQQEPDDTGNPDGEEGQPEAQQGQDGADERNEGPDRISLKALKGEDRKLMAQAVDMVRQGKAESVAQALAELAPPPPKAEPKPDDALKREAQAEPEAEPEKDTAITSIKDKIKDLRAKRRQAITDFDREAEADLTEQIEDAVLELQSAKEAAKEQLAQRREAERNHARQVDVVKAKYPDSADPESDFSQRLKDKIDLAVYRQDDVLNDPDYLVILAERVAKEMGAKSSTPAKQPVAPPKAPARPVMGGVAPSAAPTQPMSREQALKAIDTMPLDQLDALLFGRG